MTSHPARGDFDPIPSIRRPVQVTVVTDAAIGGRGRGAGRPGLRRRGAAGRPGRRRRPPGGRRVHRAAGQTLVVPGEDGRALVALGIGDGAEVDLTLGPRPGRRLRPGGAAAPDPRGRAARVRYGALRRRLRAGRRRGRAARPLALLRRPRRRRADADLAHARGPGGRRRRGAGRCRPGSGDRPRRRDQPRPVQLPGHDADGRPDGEVAVEVGPDAGLEVEVFDEEQLIEMGCGGILGVNLGSIDEPRLIKLPYRPDVADGSPRPGRQGHHVRLRRHQPQAERRVARPDEERHDRRRRDPRRDDRAAGARLHGRGHGVPLLHRQHAVRLGDEARRRAPDAQRDDGRGAQHRRRGPSGDGRRALPGRRGRRRRGRRHRHPDRRVPAHLRRRDRRRDGQRPRL